MESFERCSIAMLGGPCLQHVTRDTSRLPGRTIDMPGQIVYSVRADYNILRENYYSVRAE